jgi:hypothetical protein
MIRKLSENKALAQLQRLKSSYQRFIKANYEHAAESCKTCLTPGACCTDEHWVNVRITRLEAVAIKRTLELTPKLTDPERRDVYRRAADAVSKYNLHRTPNEEKQTYSCPLFDRRVGCLVHHRAKPAPCIHHACYENWQDLPPERLLARTEHRVAQLNQSVYGDDWESLPIPVWLADLR